MKTFFVYVLLFVSSSVFAAEKCKEELLLAAVDPVFDTEHVEIKNQLWTNPREIPDNKIDDDNNGFIDDVHGWDVADSDNDISIKFSDDYCPAECRKFGALAYRRRSKMATKEELAWLEKTEKENPDILKKWRGFITLIHGTGTVSVALEGTKCTHWYGLKTSNDEEFKFLPNPTYNLKGTRPSDEQLDKTAMEVRNEFLKPFNDMREYISKNPVRVSTHVYYMDGFAESFKERVRKKFDFELDDTTALKFERPQWRIFVSESRRIFTENPHVLFIFPTNNAAENVDDKDYFPMTQQLPNTLVMQASEGFVKPAAFTGYGHLADLAIPTIDIPFAIYGHAYMKGSATSLSVPLAANVAIKMLEINPHLTAKELKQILVKTARKVKSFAQANKNSAVLDADAALLAARHSVKK